MSIEDGVRAVEVWRGDYLEAVHLGHAVVCDARGEVIEAWGDPDLVFLPRSAVKIIQALPMVESGAAKAHGLSQAQLSLSCASHIASDIHVTAVREWLSALGLSDDALACGPQSPRDRSVRDALIRAGDPVCRCHNNCSGKHCGMLTFATHIGADLDYTRPDNPVQVAIRQAFEELTGEPVPGFGIDGCSAPNFAGSLKGFATAMAKIASANEGGSVRDDAAFALRNAMAARPEMVSGVGEPCTELMRAMGGRVTIKGGAEGSYTAILPEKGWGVALKAADGSKRAQDVMMTSLLVHLGVLDRNDPVAVKFGWPEQKNFAGLHTGIVRPALGFPA